MFGFFLAMVLLIGSGIMIVRHFRGISEQNRATSVRSSDVTYVLRDSGGLKTTDALKLIEQYFTAYYSSLGTLKPADLTQYYGMEDSDSYASARINQAVLNYLIFYRSNGVCDLGFSSCICGVTITDAKTDGDRLEIKLVSDESMQFVGYGDVTSSMCGVEHTFVLKKTSDGYRILTHIYEDSVYSELEESLKDASDNASLSNDQIKQLIDQRLSDMESDAKKNLDTYESQRQAYLADPSGYPLTLNAAYDYKREDAVAYAEKWVGDTAVIRNDSVWETYDYAGGNCANFVSQCIFAGGIPMDVTGDEIWKWYNDTPDSTSAKSGRSPSWTQVGYFYDYCTGNSGYGIVAETANNLYSAEIGDGIMMDWGDGWSHVVLITEVVKDENGNVVDYLINSNTSDRKNYPLSAYGCVKMSAIRIAGWNK